MMQWCQHSTNALTAGTLSYAGTEIKCIEHVQPGPARPWLYHSVRREMARRGEHVAHTPQAMNPFQVNLLSHDEDIFVALREALIRADCPIDSPGVRLTEQRVSRSPHGVIIYESADLAQRIWLEMMIWGMDTSRLDE